MKDIKNRHLVLACLVGVYIGIFMCFLSIVLSIALGTCACTWL